MSPDPYAPTRPAVEVWRLRSSSGRRVAVCWAVPHPLGIELVIAIDGDPYLTHVHRDLITLDEEAQALKARLVGKGWA